jgi:hypothetical protein
VDVLVADGSVARRERMMAVIYFDIDISESYGNQKRCKGRRTLIMGRGAETEVCNNHPEKGDKNANDTEDN